MIRRVLATLGFCAAAATTAFSAHAYSFFAGGAPCNSPSVRHGIAAHQEMRRRCGDLFNGYFDISGTEQTWADRSWQSWWVLNTNNFATWINFGPSCYTYGESDRADPFIAVIKGAAWGNGGYTYSKMGSTCFLNGGFAWLNPYEGTDIEVDADWAVARSSCKNGEIMHRNLIWVHEFGHSYGYSHFDNWLSTMNTTLPLISGCGDNLEWRPSSDGQQAHHDQMSRMGTGKGVFGLDVSGSNTIQTGALTGGGGWAVPGSTITIGTGTVNSNVQITSMNQRQALSSGYRIDLFLSSSSISTLKGGGGTRTYVAAYTINDIFAGAIYNYTLPISFAGTTVPSGTTMCVFAEWDRFNAFTDAYRGDNLHDTKFCFTRP